VAPRSLTPGLQTIARGFDHFNGLPRTEVSDYPLFGILGGKDFQRNDVSIDDGGYEVDLRGRKAVWWIR
jgi:hypothetical protein